MSIRARVAFKEDGKGKSIYLHFAENVERTLPFLITHYSDVKKVKDLINLGDASFLGESVFPKTKTHSYKTPEEGVTVFYGRDRGEMATQAKRFYSFKQLEKQAKDSFADFLYIFDCDKKLWEYKRII